MELHFFLGALKVLQAGQRGRALIVLERVTLQRAGMLLMLPPSRQCAHQRRRYVTCVGQGGSEALWVDQLRVAHGFT